MNFGNYGIRDHYFRLPMSMIVIPIAVLLTAWLVSGCWKSILRSRRAQCRSCGYDLRGLPSGVVCPECGKAAVVGPPGRKSGEA